MGYVFYIAKKRVAELLTNTDYDGRFDGCEITESMQNSDESNLNINFLGIALGKKTSYGNPKIVKYNQDKNNNYLLKLNYLLSNKKCPKICELKIGEKLENLFSYKGNIEVEKIDVDKGIVCLSSIDDLTNIEIKIDCSLKNFSEFIEENTVEGNRINQQDFIHSGNSAFFRGDIKLSIQGVFEVIQYLKEQKKLYCRAIYMYTADEDIIL